ncbi:MAG: hypothetical protein ABR584_09305 [Candidatus Baltobacteraceae bacterium]
MTDIEQIPISDEVLTVMRRAATFTLKSGEQFITMRAVMLSLMQEPAFSEAFAEVVDLQSLEAMIPDERDAPGVQQMPEERMAEGEQPALLRYDTLAFKDEAGQQSVWLNGESHALFLEGARHTESRFLPRNLILAFVNEARRQPHVLRDLKIDAGKFSEIAFALP